MMEQMDDWRGEHLIKAPPQIAKKICAHPECDCVLQPENITGVCIKHLSFGKSKRGAGKWA
jgi:hypothetical protein